MRYLILALPFVLCGCVAELLPKIQHALFIAERAQEVAQTAAGIGVPYATEAAFGVGIFAALMGVLQRQLMKRLQDGVDGAHVRIKKLKDANGTSVTVPGSTP